MPNKQQAVPKEVTNPIGYLYGHGWVEPKLALEWRMSVSSVQKLRAFRHIPSVQTAQLMARTFGWTTGQVINFWERRAPARKLRTEQRKRAAGGAR